MSLGALIAIVVLLIAIICLLVPLPGWAVLVMLASLAVAILVGGIIVPWRTP